ncbi:MAG TPA: FtsX-like permease family protein, partial [Nocardioides sp.]
MTRALRGAWSRRGVLATLAVMTLAVVAGAATVIGFAETAGTSRLLAAPLLLLGAVAVPAVGRELATARREEIGLARLRGIHGGRLVAVLLGEPATVILLGALLGLGLAALLVPLVTSGWLDEAGTAWTPAVLATAAGSAVAGLVAVLVGAWGPLREPLATQVSTTPRPRRATTFAIFLSLLALSGAAVAVYRSRVVDGQPDLLVL